MLEAGTAASGWPPLVWQPPRRLCCVSPYSTLSCRSSKRSSPTTVRGVCYQFFAPRLIGSMARSETARVSRVLTQAREDGIVPWESVTDGLESPR